MNPWILLIIPVVASAVLLFGFRHKVVWWEIAIQYVVTIILISFCNFIGVESQIYDTEYWGGYVTKVEHYDAWDEYIHQTCSYTTCDSKGENCTTHYYDCSYVDYHPEHWYAATTIGGYGISEAQYKKLAIKFGGREIFEDMHRDYHSIDGDMHYVDWPRTRATIEDVTDSRGYKNKPRAAINVFQFQKLDSAERNRYKPYDYPPIHETFKQKQLLGITDKVAEHELNVLNATLDAKKKLRVYVCVFKNQPREAGIAQERYWEGGNKNEFVITIGTDGHDNITWCHTFSWTHAEESKVNVRHYIEARKNISTENLVSTFAYLERELNSTYSFNDFTEFEYLTVYPTMSQIFWTGFSILLITIGSGIWIIKNEFEHA